MKIRKLLSVLAAAAVTASYVFTTGIFEASALTTNFTSVMKDGKTVAEYLQSAALTDGVDQYFTIRANVDGSLPSKLSKDDLEAMSRCFANDVKFSIIFTITDPDTDLTYKAIIDNATLGGLNSTNVKNNGGINLALQITSYPSDYKLELRGLNASAADLGFPIKYNIDYNYWRNIAENSNIPIRTDIGLYSISGDVKIDEVSVEANCKFTISDSVSTTPGNLTASRTGVYLTYKKLDDTITRAEARGLIESLIMNYIGLDENDIDKNDASFTNVLEYVDNSVDNLSSKLGKYVEKDSLDGLVKNYVDNNMQDLVDAVIADSSLDDKISAAIYKEFGLGTTPAQETVLKNYLRDGIVKDITDSLKTYATKPTELSNTVEAIAESKASSAVSGLKAEIQTELANTNKKIDDIYEMIADGTFKGDRGEKGDSAYESAKKNGLVPDGMDEIDWILSLHGKNGLSAYQIAVANNLTDAESEAEWILSLNGKNGLSAYQIAKLNHLTEAETEAEWLLSLNGANGKSAYEIAKENGLTTAKTEAEWILSLKGANGKSAYELAKENNLTDAKTEAEWLLSLNGEGGKSAYELAKANNLTDAKTEAEWILSLNGAGGKSAYEIAKDNKLTDAKSEAEWILSLNGTNGKSAYELAKANGLTNAKTEAEWLLSLNGAGGKSAYELAKENKLTNAKTETEWLLSLNGTNGKSAYELARDAGLTNGMSELEWLRSLSGQDGLSAYELAKKYNLTTANSELEWLNSLKGKDGETGARGESFEEWAIRNYSSIGGFLDYVASLAATQVPGGKSAYEIAVDNGFKGSESSWLRSLVGRDGMSAYEIALEYGFSGTEEQWLESIRGEDGYSAYEIAVDNGFNGTELEWLNSLAGENSSVVYINGEYGPIPVDGEDYEDNAAYIEGEDTEGEAPDSTGGENVYIDPEDGEDGEYVDDHYVDGDGFDGEDAMILPGDNSYTDNSYNRNPATGVAVGILIPAATVSSVLLLKKQKRRRGRR